MYRVVPVPADESTGGLRHGANGPINEEAVSKGPVDLGAVAVTGTCDLDAEYVVHAAAMPHYGDGRATAESIRDATLSALRKADELGCESVVVPVIGTGAVGFGFETGAAVVRGAIDGYDATSVRDVRVVAYSTAEYERLRGVADRVRTG